MAMGPEKKKEYIGKIILIIAFLAGFAIFIGWMLIYGPGLDVFHLSALDLVLLVFATYRLGHLIAYDRVMEPVRQFFTETIPDPTGAGETVEPKGTGFQQALGQLVCCPICAGTWVAAGLVYGLYLFPAPMRVFLTMTAVIGAAELLNAAGEAWSWSGQYARTMSGAKTQLQRSEQQTPEELVQPAKEEPTHPQVARILLSGDCPDGEEKAPEPHRRTTTRYNRTQPRQQRK